VREVRLIPFVSDEDLEMVRDDDAVRVTNPLQADEGWLRTRLLPGLLATARRNVRRHVRSVAVFEVDTVFRMVDGQPVERPKAAFAMTGNADPGWASGDRPFDVFDAKGVVEALMAELGIGWSLGAPAGRPFHPGRRPSRKERRASRCARRDPPDGRERLDIRGGRGGAGGRGPRRTAALRAVEDARSRRPADLAFTVEASTPAERVRSALAEAAGDLVSSVLLFDVFEGPPLPEGTRSLAFSLDFRAGDRTLTDEEADGAVAAIVERLSRDFGAQLRSG
jgi:phenylalanyl-tRNA synthetase beta chain